MTDTPRSGAGQAFLPEGGGIFLVPTVDGSGAHSFKLVLVFENHSPFQVLGAFWDAAQTPEPSKEELP